MTRIKLHDKFFKLYMPYREIEESVQRVADKLNRDLAGIDTPIFLSVLNGSFIFTASLLQRIEFQCDIVFIKLASYSGTQSTGDVKQIMGLTTSVKGRTVVIVEDIVDTGNTIETLYDILKKEGAADVKVCTLMFKPDSYGKSVPIDYAANAIPNDFIVGFGLDYDQLGRQYKDIYVIDENQN